MVNRSTLDPDNLPGHTGRKAFKGHEPRSLGPNDGSDPDADLTGPGLIDDDLLNLDRVTNEVSQAGHLDIAPDRIVGAEEAGLGGGLDQAEEAQLGVTDEELEEMARSRRTPKK